MHLEIYRQVSSGELRKHQISTLLNVNREIYLSNQNLLATLADPLLDMDAAEEFAGIPLAG